MFNVTVAAKFSTHAKIIYTDVAYRSTFLRPNACEKKIISFCQVLKKDVQKRKLVPFFCLTVYVFIVLDFTGM